MTKTEHLQKIILGIVKDIDRICTENDIEYFLFGGSALGAKRHQGFIPWDDDLDITLLPEYYDKFITVCKTKLDTSKYVLQEGFVDWPEHFSKIRLKGTHIIEEGSWQADKDKDGIFVDVFRVDYASNSKWGRARQYFYGKLWLAYIMNLKGYIPDSPSKKSLSILAKCLGNKHVLNFVKKRYLKYNARPTGWISDVLGRTRWHNAFVPRAVYGRPTRVPFEDVTLPAHQDLHAYLTITYGDYMQLPPVENRVGSHIESIDFGSY